MAGVAVGWGGDGSERHPLGPYIANVVTEKGGDELMQSPRQGGVATEEGERSGDSWPTTVGGPPGDAAPDPAWPRS